MQVGGLGVKGRVRPFRKPPQRRPPLHGAHGVVSWRTPTRNPSTPCLQNRYILPPHRGGLLGVRALRAPYPRGAPSTLIKGTTSSPAGHPAAGVVGTDFRPPRPRGRVAGGGAFDLVRPSPAGTRRILTSRLRALKHAEETQGLQPPACSAPIVRPVSSVNIARPVIIGWEAYRGTLLMPPSTSRGSATAWEDSGQCRGVSSNLDIHHPHAPLGA